MQNEPLVAVASIGALLTAALGVVVVFVPLPEGAVDAIQVLISAAAPFVVGLIARRWVSPAGKLRDPLPPSPSE